MAVTLNSTVWELILAVGEVIKNSDGSTTVEVEIPDQPFYLEITIKAKEEATNDK